MPALQVNPRRFLIGVQCEELKGADCRTGNPLSPWFHFPQVFGHYCQHVGRRDEHGSIWVMGTVTHHLPCCENASAFFVRARKRALVPTAKAALDSGEQFLSLIADLVYSDCRLHFGLLINKFAPYRKGYARIFQAATGGQDIHCLLSSRAFAGVVGPVGAFVLALCLEVQGCARVGREVRGKLFTDGFVFETWGAVRRRCIRRPSCDQKRESSARARCKRHR